jgi:DNA polymerase-3 subunit delta
MSKTSGLILLYGDDAARMDRALQDHIEKALPDPTARAFSLESFDGDTTDIDTLLMSAQSQSFFGSRRVLLVRQPAFLEAGARKKGAVTADQEKALLAYCADPNPTSLVILRMLTEDKPGAFLKKVAEACGASPYNKPKGAEISDRIRAYIKDAGCTADGAALLLLEEAARNMDTARMDSELEKLLLYVGPGTSIREEDVAAVLSPTTGTTIFNLTDAILAGRTQRALDALKDCLFLGMKPPQVLYQVLETVRRLLMVQSMLEEHMTAEAITKAIGRHAYYVKKLIQNARRLSPDTLSRLYVYLVDCDVKSKSTSSLDMTAFIEEIVINCAAACAIRRR